MRLFTFLCCCLIALQLPAQSIERSVIGNAGTLLTGRVGSLQFTVGEVAVERTDNTLSLARGFHRAKAEVISTSSWSVPDIDLALSVYPNPTPGELTLTGAWDTGDRVTITNILGRRVLDVALTPLTAHLSLREYPSGTYLLTISRAGRPLRSLRVVRQ
ncbi:putative secreted protein (Por secretion system target) [Neolewinella xylanilytica]|uniref:Putative secreted protein (Por secretion system target) n=1 Tax=Neolewinella xylanilytica TaxID=1514080 RepID=A0A2S6I0V4_9BACT|nr:T9SS type A sorting domain-containing protein [Neolewinella xylanilytica]PPK84598.1 putative secreted protein (Por secretion system target) [Neolewinella xylanilytica]